MGLARVAGVSLTGLAGTIVTVEVDIASGLPGLAIVGLADAAIDQSRHRIRSAIVNSVLEYPQYRVTVNLSPASVQKHGTGFDLPIALALLSAQATIPSQALRGLAAVAELGLDGRLRPVRGILPAVRCLRDHGIAKVVVSSENACEAGLVEGVEVLAAASLRHVLVKLGADLPLAEHDVEPHTEPVEASSSMELELADVLGQREAVDGLIAAAAGGHHCLFVGDPGSGKTMLASRLPSLLPDLDDESALEVTSIHSLVADTGCRRLIRRPPWQSPHHSATMPALIGGGSGWVRPGAISLASHGVLFLDEAPEFSARMLDALRQSLESGSVEIHRSHGASRFPARYQLILAANPCPCGNALSTAGICTCTPMTRLRYMKRLSGPLLDRIDIQIIVTRVSLLAATEPAPSSSETRERIVAARARARSRLDGTGLRLNCEVPGSLLRSDLKLPARATATLDTALERGLLTLRGYDRALRVAWSLADLAEEPAPTNREVGRALSWRKALT